MSNKIDRSRRADLIFAAGMTVLLCLMVLRAFRSVGYSDDSLFVMTALRLVKGDRLLVDDWHLTQLNALFLYLPVRLFYAIVKSTDGIMLYMRFLYIFARGATAAATYTVLKKHGPAASAASALLFFYNIPLNAFMILYYNSLLCLFLQGIFLLIVSNIDNPSAVKLFFCGVLFAAAVVESPYCALFYFIWTVTVFILALIRKTGKKIKFAVNEFFSVKTWCPATAGIFAVFVGFVAVVLSRASLGEIIRNLPNIFDDFEYPGGVLYGAKKFVYRTFSFYYGLYKTFPPYLMIPGAAVFISACADKGRYRRKALYVSLAAVWCAVSLAVIFTHLRGSFELRIPQMFSCMAFVLFGAVCFIVTENKSRNRIVFSAGYIISLQGMIARNYESETGFMSGSAMAPVTLTAAVFAVSDVVREIRAESPEIIRKPYKNITAMLAAAALVFQLAAQTDCATEPFYMAEYMFGMSTSYEAMDVRLERGPMKGITTTRNVAQVYNNTLDDLDIIGKEYTGSLFVPAEFAWIYLYLDKADFGTYSGYIKLEYWCDFNRDKVNRYFEYHPEKYPSYIYIPFCNSKYKTGDEDKNWADEAYEDIIRTYYGRTVKGKAGYVIKVMNR